ncbi:ABC transporter transmembrane region 2-domain-containing protein [Obelidium mucronatum]|nr:ABC transporter transmembrane region 2-domain-containing protein [Obelidium mucronatum]
MPCDCGTTCSCTASGADCKCNVKDAAPKAPPACTCGTVLVELTELPANAVLLSALSLTDASVEPAVLMGTFQPDHIGMKVDSLFAKRLFRLLSLASTATALDRLIPVLALLCAIAEVLAYLAGTRVSQIYPALASKDFAAFITLIATCTTLYLTYAACTVFLDLVQLKSILSETSALLDNSLRQPPLDNPDQTITQDIDKFADMVTQIFLKVLPLPLLVVYYTIETYNVTQSMLSPVIIVLFYFSSWLICRVAMNPVVPAVYAKEKAEGDFRFSHVNTRTKAEAIAFMHTESTERNRLDHLLDSVIDAGFTVLNKNVPLQYLTESTMYLASVLTYVVVAIPVFDGSFDDKTEAEISGIVAKNLFVCLYLIHQFTILTKLSESFKLTQLSGFTTRISMLLETCDTLENNCRKRETELQSVSTIGSSGSNIPITTTKTYDATDVLLQIKNLTYTTFSSKVSFTITKGSHTLITGPSGCGKSSLLRTLAHIQQHQVPYFRNLHQFTFIHHSIKAIAPASIFASVEDHVFATTRSPLYPLMVQVMYPDTPCFGLDISDASSRNLEDSDGSSDEGRVQEMRVTEILEQVQLGHLDFAMPILYWKPMLCFVDEGLSAVDEAMECALWEEVMACGVTVVAVRHGRTGDDRRRDHVERLFGQKICLE